jgi:hypothetical protein
MKDALRLDVAWVQLNKDQRRGRSRYDSTHSATAREHSAQYLPLVGGISHTKDCAEARESYIS